MHDIGVTIGIFKRQVMRGTSRDVLCCNGQLARFDKNGNLNMIKSLKTFAALVACVFSVNGFAGTITDYERIDVNTKLSAGQHVSWTHNILEHGFVLGTAESASIVIELKDDQNDFWLFPFEVALVKLGNFDLQDGGLNINPVESWFGNLGVSSLAKLNADGTLFVEVWSTLGDFFVGQSTLTVKTSSVPESSSLVLLALGLLGLGVMRKKARA